MRQRGNKSSTLTDSFSRSLRLGERRTCDLKLGSWQGEGEGVGGKGCGLGLRLLGALSALFTNEAVCFGVHRKRRVQRCRCCLWMQGHLWILGHRQGGFVLRWQTVWGGLHTHSHKDAHTHTYTHACMHRACLPTSMLIHM